MTTEGKLHLAPINSNIQRVLDIGTGGLYCFFSLGLIELQAEPFKGTGIWAVEFGKRAAATLLLGLLD